LRDIIDQSITYVLIMLVALFRDNNYHSEIIRSRLLVNKMDNLDIDFAAVLGVLNNGKYRFVSSRQGCRLISMDSPAEE